MQCTFAHCVLAGIERLRAFLAIEWEAPKRKCAHSSGLKVLSCEDALRSVACVYEHECHAIRWERCGGACCRVCRDPPTVWFARLWR
jgi:hypothetical protein